MAGPRRVPRKRSCGTWSFPFPLTPSRWFSRAGMYKQAAREVLRRAERLLSTAEIASCALFWA